MGKKKKIDREAHNKGGAVPVENLPQVQHT